MTRHKNIRLGWLRFMYIYTIAGAGVLGLGMIANPDFIKSLFGWPAQDPIIFGIVGSTYLAFGFLSFLGLYSPLKFAPILFLQMCYKMIWLIGVIAPFLVAGQLPSHSILLIIIFCTYIIGDLIAIPFSYLFQKDKNI